MSDLFIPSLPTAFADAVGSFFIFTDTIILTTVLKFKMEVYFIMNNFNDSPIEVKWRLIGDNNEYWNSSGCLYAYLHPKTYKILYIGKADGTTVKERWSAEDKDELWNCLNKNGIKKHIPIIGFVYLPELRRFSSELLKDIEGLLIYLEQPICNINNKKTRGISRPGMIIKCSGEIWPGKEIYKDK